MDRQNDARWRLALVFTALVALLGVRSAFAGDAVVYGPADDVLAIRASDMPLSDLARELSQKTGIDLEVPPDLAARAVTLNVALPMERALHQLFREVGVQNHAVVYGADGRTTYMLLSPQPARAGAPARLHSARVAGKDAPPVREDPADDVDDEKDDLGANDVGEDDPSEETALEDGAGTLLPPRILAQVAPSLD
jgi:hypothetical protein